MKLAPPVTRQHAAAITGLSVRTIDRLIASGELKAHKFKRAVRIDGESFQRWFEAAAKSTTSVHTHLSRNGDL